MIHPLFWASVIFATVLMLAAEHRAARITLSVLGLLVLGAGFAVQR